MLAVAEDDSIAKHQNMTVTKWSSGYDSENQMCFECFLKCYLLIFLIREYFRRSWQEFFLFYFFLGFGFGFGLV